VKLFAFTKAQNKTKSEAASELGLKPQVFGRYGSRVPRKKIVERIYAWSGGRVQPNDFYDLPPLTVGRVAKAGASSATNARQTRRPSRSASRIAKGGGSSAARRAAARRG